MGGNETHFGSFPFSPFFLGVTTFRTGPLISIQISGGKMGGGDEVSGGIRKIGYFLGLGVTLKQITVSQIVVKHAPCSMFRFRNGEVGVNTLGKVPF